MKSHQRPGMGIVAMSLLTIAFGLLTIREGGSILFGSGASRAAAGNYVPFVLWFNFVAGFAYILAGVGLRAAYVGRHELADTRLGGSRGARVARALFRPDQPLGGHA